MSANHPGRRQSSARTGLAVVVALATLAGACGAGADDAWGERAELVVSELAAAYDIADPYQTARFFTAGGTLDFSVWDLGVATTPEEVVRAVSETWFTRESVAEVRADHLFVTPDSALVWWSAYLGLEGGSTWAQTYLFGPGSGTASQAFRDPEEQSSDPPDTRAMKDLAARYVDAWTRADRAALENLYAPAVTVRNDMTGEVWTSATDLLADLDSMPQHYPGPAPGFFLYEPGRQMIVLVQLGGECPQLEARRLVLDANSIVKETRYTHVPSARRCRSGLPEGWWADFELPGELQENVTAALDAGGSLVQLINAEPVQQDFARWLFDRYVAAGLGQPDIAAVWFPPAPECDTLGGLAIESDQRFEGRHTVVICSTEDELRSDSSESGWSPSAIAYGLHEFAHVWMLDRLTDDVRNQFNDLIGLTVWRGNQADWSHRGVEQAAFTIPWGIAGAEDARWQPFFPAATCEQLAQRYRLLTGHEPLTPCGDGGWSP